MPAGDARGFVLGDAAVTDAALLAALAAAGGRLGWADGGRVRAVRRTWLDTFDWRLRRAGLALVQAVAAGGTELTVTDSQGRTVAVQRLAAGQAPRWPCLAGQLPDGPVRAAVQGAAGIRALAPVARAGSRISELRVLNGDAKTVARLLVDRMSATFPAAAAVPARLTLTAVRGYQEEASGAARAVAAVPGVAPGGDSALGDVLAAAGARPGSPGRATPVPLDPQAPAAAGLAAVLTALLDALEANVPGSIRAADTEFLHDLRIAVRRTRSALKLCGSVLPDGLAAEFRPEFRWLGELTAPARDLDVYLLGYPAMAAGLAGATHAELEPLHEYLLTARAAAHRRLASGLRSARMGRLRAGWRSALAGVQPARRRPTVAELADTRIAAAHRRVLLAGRAITPASPPERLHDLRKRCKELRYLTDMFGSLPAGGRRPAVRELRALQDCLGEFQDAEVQYALIRQVAAELLAGQLAPAATLLAMGEVAAGLARRQQRARAEFDGRFAQFDAAATAAQGPVRTAAA